MRYVKRWYLIMPNTTVPIAFTTERERDIALSKIHKHTRYLAVCYSGIEPQNLEGTDAEEIRRTKKR